MRKLLVITLCVIYGSITAQEVFSIPTISSIDYKEINKSGKNKLYVFLTFNECQTCYKITDEKLKILDDNIFTEPDPKSTETSKVFSFNSRSIQKPINLLYTYKVNGKKKKFSFPIFDKIPKVDDDKILDVQLKYIKKYENNYVELKVSIPDTKNLTIEGIQINDFSLLYQGFKVVNEGYDIEEKASIYIIRITDRLLNNLNIKDSIFIKVKLFGFVLSNKSHSLNLVKGNSVKIDRIELKNTLTKDANYVEYLDDVFEVNNGSNEIKITTNNNTSKPTLKLMDIKGKEITVFKYERINSGTNNIFIFRFKLGDCCIGNAAYKLIVM